MRYPETAALIRSARRRKGLSQEAAAEAIGCSRLQVIRWEQGLHRPDPEGLGPRLVEVLGVKAKALTEADADDEEAAQVDDMTLALTTALRAVVAAELAKFVKAAA